MADSPLRARMNVAIDTLGFRLAKDDDVPVAEVGKAGIPEHVVKSWLRCGLARDPCTDHPEAPMRAAEHSAPEAVKAHDVPKPKRRSRKKSAAETAAAGDAPAPATGEDVPAKDEDAEQGDIQ